MNDKHNKLSDDTESVEYSYSILDTDNPVYGQMQFNTDAEAKTKLLQAMKAGEISPKSKIIREAIYE